MHRIIEDNDDVFKTLFGVSFPDITKVETFSSTQENRYENEKSLVWEIAVPGFKKEDISVEFVKGKYELKVEAKKDKEIPLENAKYMRTSIPKHITCTYKVDKSWNIETLKVSLENGILTIKMDRLKEIPTDNIKFTID